VTKRSLERNTAKERKLRVRGKRKYKSTRLGKRREHTTSRSNSYEGVEEEARKMYHVPLLECSSEFEPWLVTAESATGEPTV
jgi:hypothetical protein